MMENEHQVHMKETCSEFGGALSMGSAGFNAFVIQNLTLLCVISGLHTERAIHNRSDVERQ